MNETHPFFTPHYPADYQLKSLKALETALGRVGLYASWRALDPGPRHSIDDRFAVLPALNKKDLREHFPNVVPPEQSIERAVAAGEIDLVQTSGTTDDKITNLWNQRWWDACEKSSWALNSHTALHATGEHHEAILVNPKNVGIASDAVDLPIDTRRLSRFLYLNEKTDPLAWTDRIQNRMIDELNSFQPSVLEANPSMLARLSRFISASGRRVHQPGVIVFTYEYPSRLHRRQIRRVFDVPMASSYGTTEVGYVFMECEAGRLHQNSDFCRVDFQPFKEADGGPSVGRILVTPLGNAWNYMIRFNTGDIVRLEHGDCPCGRNSGMILSSILGRTVNLTLACEGRLVTLEDLDEKISRLDGVNEYKLVQSDLRSYELRLAPVGPKRQTIEREATRMLKEIYGAAARISVVFEEAIAPESSGKYLLSRALFPIEVEDFLA